MGASIPCLTTSQNATAPKQEFLSKTHGIDASEDFLKLPLDRQRSATAGINAAVARFGKGDADKLKLMTGSSRDDGRFDPFEGTILLNKNGESAYIVSYHETIHAIDAAKSEKMKEFPATSGLKAYNLHSKKVLEEARKSLKLKANQKAYKDMLFEVFGYSTDLYNKYSNNPGEIVAWALDREERGKSNALSKAIAERF